jgi:AcrR family transcriptional regulator
LAEQQRLAGTHEGRPGLPRGRSRLPQPVVRQAQRQRLLRAVISVVAEQGFGEATVADVVSRARVSRATFYAHFKDKEACFLAATGHGGRLMREAVREAVRDQPAGAPPEAVLRASLEAFLGFLAAEPEFAWAFYAEMPAAGRAAVERLLTANREYAQLTFRWHRQARAGGADWPAVPEAACLALAGATAELVREWVRSGRLRELPELGDLLVDLHLVVLAGRRWPDRVSDRAPAAR